MSNPLWPSNHTKADASASSAQREQSLDTHGKANSAAEIAQKPRQDMHAIGYPERSTLKPNSNKLIAQGTDTSDGSEKVVKWKSDDPDERWKQLASPGDKPKVIIFKEDGCVPCVLLQKSALGDAEKQHSDQIDFYQITVNDPKDMVNDKIIIDNLTKNAPGYPLVYYYDQNMKPVAGTVGNTPAQLTQHVQQLLDGIKK